MNWLGHPGLGRRPARHRSRHRDPPARRHPGVAAAGRHRQPDAVPDPRLVGRRRRLPRCWCGRSPGWEIVSSLSAEYRHPERDIVRATGITLGRGDRALPRHRVRDRRRARHRRRPGAAGRPAGRRVRRLGAAADDDHRGAAHHRRHQLLLRRRVPAGRLARDQRRDAALAGFRHRRRPGDAAARPARSSPGWAWRCSSAWPCSTSRPTPLCSSRRGTFALVYVVGTAAAVRLLPGGWPRAAAVVSFIASVGLVVLTGLPVVLPIAIGLAGLCWTLFSARGRSVAEVALVGRRYERESRQIPTESGGLGVDLGGLGGQPRTIGGCTTVAGPRR